MDETYIFQFLSQEYNGSTQTREGLETMVKDTFLSGSTSSAGTPGGSADPGAPAGSGSQGGYDDSNYGPGVVGPGASSSGTGGSKVSLEPPGLSISAKERWIVGDKISLEPPGASQGTSAQGPGVSGPGASGSSQGPGGSDSSSQQPESSTGGAPSSGTVSYIDIIMNAGAQSGVNPYVLAAMIIQEQGTAGTSPLISGTYSGYEGYYNFFNVEAYQSGSMSAIQRGLWYASQSGSYGRPWNTVEKSIVGGAQNYGDNYVKAGQNTFYLKKFNVQGSNLYKHQYMSNVQAAASEGAKLSQAYTAAMKQSALEFIIPVYNNMPGQACAAPTGDGSPNNKLSSLSVDGFSLTPTFARDTESYNLIVDTSVSSVNIQAGAADAKARVSGAGTVSLGAENTDITVTVTAENGSVRNYVIHVAKQGGGPTGAGGAQAPAGEGSSGPGAAGPGVSGPGQADTSGPGGSNVTVVTVTN